jgi:hypothetical protein
MLPDLKDVNGLQRFPHAEDAGERSRMETGNPGPAARPGTLVGTYLNIGHFGLERFCPIATFFGDWRAVNSVIGLVFRGGKGFGEQWRPGRFPRLGESGSTELAEVLALQSRRRGRARPRHNVRTRVNPRLVTPERLTLPLSAPARSL